MNLVRDTFFGKTAFGDVLSLPGVYGIEEFINAKI